MSIDDKGVKLGLEITLYFWCFLILPGDKSLCKKPVFLSKCLIQEAREGNLFSDLADSAILLMDFGPSPRKTQPPFKQHLPFKAIHHLVHLWIFFNYK